jgi:hypothetical protein
VQRGWNSLLGLVVVDNWRRIASAATFRLAGRTLETWKPVAKAHLPHGSFGCSCFVSPNKICGHRITTRRKTESQIAMQSSNNANVSKLQPSSDLEKLVSNLRDDTLRTYAREVTITKLPATSFNIDRHQDIRNCIEQMYTVIPQ